MIVPAMTYNEIIDEIKRDIPFVFDLSVKKDRKVRRLVLKASVFPLRIYSFVTSKNKNRWLLTWEAHNRKNINDNILFAMICIANHANGRLAIMPNFNNSKDLSFSIFLPHFFQRFAERIKIDSTGEDLIRRYFQYNANFGIDIKKEMVSETKYTILATGTSTEGVALGHQLADGSFLFKTFITYEMSKGEQVDTFAKSEENRMQGHENLLKELGL